MWRTEWNLCDMKANLFTCQCQLPFWGFFFFSKIIWSEKNFYIYFFASLFFTSLLETCSVLEKLMLCRSVRQSSPLLSSAAVAVIDKGKLFHFQLTLLFSAAAVEQNMTTKVLLLPGRWAGVGVKRLNVEMDDEGFWNFRLCFQLKD